MVPQAVWCTLYPRRTSRDACPTAVWCIICVHVPLFTQSRSGGVPRKARYSGYIQTHAWLHLGINPACACPGCVSESYMGRSNLPLVRNHAAGHILTGSVSVNSRQYLWEADARRLECQNLGEACLPLRSPGGPGGFLVMVFFWPLGFSRGLQLVVVVVVTSWCSIGPFRLQHCLLWLRPLLFLYRLERNSSLVARIAIKISTSIQGLGRWLGRRP